MRAALTGVILLTSFAGFGSSPPCRTKSLANHSDGLLIKSFQRDTLSFPPYDAKMPVQSVGNKYSSLSVMIARRSAKMLRRVEKGEANLQKALLAKDSTKAKSLFFGSSGKYDQLRVRLSMPIDPATQFPLKEYVPGADSIRTALRFLEQEAGKIPGYPATKLSQIRIAGEQVRQLEGKLQLANDLQQYVKERGQVLKEQLSQYGLGKQLAAINKEAYYAQQQLTEYKALINDKSKMEQRMLAELNELPAFRGFMEKNSYLGQLFGLPADYGSLQSLAGLQTRVQVLDLISQQIGTSAVNNPNGDPAQYIHDQMQVAQSQMNRLKGKLRQLGSSGGGGDMTMPDFKPNNERVKPLHRRLVYGFNLQTGQTTRWMPSTAGLSVSIGFKFRESTIAGIGGSYRLGVGNGLDHLAFSNQGVGIRSYFERKAKGNWWLSGGIEFNYMQAFAEWRTLRQPDVWQKSALIGLLKKYKITGHKLGTIQLLFDALYKQHFPASSPLIFRMGYQL